MKSLLIILSTVCVLYAQTTWSISGAIDGPSLNWAQDVPMFTITLSNGGGTTTSWDVYVSGIGFMWGISVNDGWSGTTTPSRTGYTFSPAYRTAAPVHYNIGGCDFIATDVMAPDLYIRTPTAGKVIYLGAQDTIKSTVYDNSLEVKKYRYYLSYNNGVNWNYLGTDSAITYYLSPGSSFKVEWYMADDTSKTRCKKSFVFTADSATNQAKIMVIVYDLSNNADTAYSGTFQIVDTNIVPDTVRPTISFSEQPGDLDIYEPYTIRWDASDNIGVVSVALYLWNSSSYFKIDSVTGTTTSYNWTAPSIPGIYRFLLAAYDSAGNRGAVESNSFSVLDTVTVPEVDTIVPTVSFLGQQVDIGIGASCTIRWSASDNVGVVSIVLYIQGAGVFERIDSIIGGTRTSYDWVASVDPGDYHFIIFAYDAAGNRGLGSSNTFRVNFPTAAMPEVSPLSSMGSRYQLVYDLRGKKLKVSGLHDQLGLSIIKTTSGYLKRLKLR